MGRVLTYPQAIREATEQAMEEDPSVVLLGLGVDDPKRILGTTAGLLEKFGPERVFDTPLSEEGMTGIAIGMALAGLRPIHVHIRMDFLMLAMNQLVNIAAKKRYMTGGQEHVPLVVRAIIGKSWGQGAQHSQAFHSFFMHVPGIRVAAPTTPHDAKGCLLAAVRMNDPMLFVEHRLLYFQNGPVAHERYESEPGRARVVTPGEDITLVGVSHMVLECFRAHHYLKERGVRAEVIDPIWLNPLDLDTIVESVRRTGRLLVVDNGWVACGAGSEIVASVVERLQGERDVRVGRMGFAPVPCPPTPPLEDLFYPNARTIAMKAHEMVCGSVSPWSPE
ncbi:MAG TPA: transketolase C-terminal domain-containing protein, partial [Candidatus Binatia bacterium]|nr:transketolase C-terminal domain-containing protein [Candidatus Binatia bacterium]